MFLIHTKDKIYCLDPTDFQNIIFCVWHESHAGLDGTTWGAFVFWVNYSFKLEYIKLLLIAKIIPSVLGSADPVGRSILQELLLYKRWWVMLGSAARRWKDAPTFDQQHIYDQISQNEAIKNIFWYKHKIFWVKGWCLEKKTPLWLNSDSTTRWVFLLGLQELQ